MKIKNKIVGEWKLLIKEDWLKWKPENYTTLFFIEPPDHSFVKGASEAEYRTDRKGDSFWWFECARYTHEDMPVYFAAYCEIKGPWEWKRQELLMKITNEHEYIRALWRMEKLMDLNPEDGTDEYIEMDKLVDAIEAYEEEHEPWSREL